MRGSFEEQVAGIATLNDAIRRALYALVVGSDGGVSRDEAAAAMGLPRSVAAFHLEKLVDEGLLEFEFKRLTGRTGPGAGRPSKLYRRAAREISVSLPPREYDLAGFLLAAAVEAVGSTGRSPAEELGRISYEYGRTLGAKARAKAGHGPARSELRTAMLESLRDNGFEPRQVGEDVVLANCPFHTLAQQFASLVCGMNLHLLQGVRAGLGGGDQELVPRLDPSSGMCCVKFCMARGPAAEG
jgi:predicted ArsR family transcriptional regulator